MAGTVERTLALKLIGEVGDINKSLGKVDRSLGRTAKSALSWGKAFAGAAILGGLQGIVDASIDGVKAFREEQQAVRNFNKTVKAMGVPARKATQALDRMADRAVNLGFDDGDLIAGMDMFIKKTGSIEKATRLNALAMDIARSKNISLADAQRQVDQIYNGSARVLRAYGIEGKKGMEAVAAARKVERGKAAAWARNHPMEVLAGKIADGWADVVGNLSQGNFGGALKAGQKLVDNVVRGIAGYTSKKGKHVAGLWDRLFDATPDKQGNPKGIVNKLGQGIADQIGKVDWGKSLSDALSAGLDGLKAGIDSGGFAQIAAIGGAIAGAMFLGTLFVDAAKLVFSAPGFLAKGAVSVAAAVAGAAIGLTFRGAMFAADLFVGAAAAVLKGIAAAPAVIGAAGGLGKALGLALRAPMLAALGPVGVAIVSGLTIDQFLDSIGWGAAKTNIGKIRKRNPNASQTDMNRRRLNDPAEKGGLRGFASGGIVRARPGGMLARIGEGGEDEAIVPRHLWPAMAGGSVTNNYVTVNAPVGSSPADIGRTVQRYLDEYRKRGGRS